MSAYEVPQPILNSPFEEPKEHWHIVEGEEPEQRPGRRPVMDFYRDPKVKQSAAYCLDKHPNVEAFVKNSGLGFAIPYLHNGQMHDYVPDFIIRLKSKQPHHFILEIKGYDPAEEVKRASAERWVAAVNADGAYGQWQYGVPKKVSDVPTLLS
jgi:hypothetical protein